MFSSMLKDRGLPEQIQASESAETVASEVLRTTQAFLSS